MIIQLIASIALAGSAPSAQVKNLGSWPDGMSSQWVAHHGKVKLQNRLRHPGIASKQTSKTTLFGRAPQELSKQEQVAVNVYFESAQRAIDDAKKCIRKGNPGKAEYILRAHLSIYPGSAAVTPLLSDILFREDRIGQAYDLLAPFTTNGAMTEILLRASLAAALRGEVFEGQRRFLLQTIFDHGSYVAECPNAFLPGGDSRDLAILSYVAVGLVDYGHLELDSAQYYMQKALSLDHENPIAAYVAGSILLHKKQCRQARAVLEKGESRANGRLLGIMKEALLEARSGLNSTKERTPNK